MSIIEGIVSDCDNDVQKTQLRKVLDDLTVLRRGIEALVVASASLFRAAEG
ncbi:hypothetical protein IAG25_32785 [Caballeronia sp. EK]|uniref:hypothetical protein n=1 Tax=Caballeronia sp. EK TaxID=2767469 RepID=UPI00199F5E52|nr:hypothetical protein [Caballeronia sp. EK]MBC8641602.1 hypothetical protein [Caballeronia sp. EK]